MTAAETPTASELADRLKRLTRRSTPTFHEEGCVVELAGFRLVGLILEPAGRPRRDTGVVVCPSMFEAPAFHSAEITIARRAAECGFPAIYLHPPGFGQSEGTQSEADALQRIDTAVAATQLLGERYGDIAATCLLGIGFGGTVALAAAPRTTFDPALALWDPVVDVAAYWASAKRRSRIWQMKRTGQWQEPEELIEAHGDAVVGGMLVTRRLFDSLADVRRAIGTHHERSSPALVVSSESNLDELAGILGSDRPVETHTLGDVELGWGTKDQQQAIDATIAWMESSLR